jgi:flagellar hook-associated protein 2
VLAGVSLSVGGVSSDPVTISVSATDTPAVTAVELLVTQYNKLQDKLKQHTFFNAEDNSVGALFGSNEALRVESELSRLFSGRLFGVGSVQSLGQLGISFTDEGKLTLDKAKLQAAYAADPQALAEFFADDQSGFAAKLNTVADSLAGEGTSLLISRSETLSRKVDFNQERVEFLTARLDRQRELMLQQFFTMEATIAKFQDALSVVERIQALPPVSVGS